MNANLKLLLLLAFVLSRPWANAGTPPVFLTSPTNQTVFEGDPITIGCTASYDAGTTFYFQSTDGKTFANSTPDFYFSSAWTGLYSERNRIFATNSYGAAATGEFGIHVLPSFPGIWVRDPQIWDFGATIVLSSNDVFSVQGKPPLTYSLYYNGLLIQKTNQLSFLFSNVTPAQDGAYQLVVENTLGSATNAFNVLVKESLRLLSHSGDQIIPIGGTATFKVVAESSGTIRYHWLHTGNSIEAVKGTNSSITITNATFEDAGRYSCYLTVENDAGTTYGDVEDIFLDLNSPRPIDQWQRLSPKFGDADLFGVASDGRITIAVGGNGTIWKSTNRIDWTRAVSPVTDALLEVAYGNGQFVAIGSQLPYPSPPYFHSSKESSTVVTSPNGTDWKLEKSPESELLWSIAFGAGRFVAISKSQIFSSADGFQWTLSPTIIEKLVKVRFVNNRFIAMGANQIALSEDGLSWEVVSSPEGFYAVAGNESEYIAISSGLSSSRVWRSTNAVNWILMPGTFNFSAVDVAFNDGEYAAVGYSRFCCGEGRSYQMPQFATSRDGSAWNFRHLNCDGALRSVLPDQSGFLAVGDLGNVVFISDTGSAVLRGSIARAQIDVLSSFVQSSGSLIIRPIQVGGLEVYYTDSIAATADLKTWYSIQLSHKAYFLTYGNGVFLTVKDANYSTSTDGFSWSDGSLPFVTYTSGLGFDGRRFIGSFYSSTPYEPYVAISSNAVDWTRITGPKYFTEMSGANGLAILPGYDSQGGPNFSVSTNGVDWVSKPLFTQPAKVIFDGTRYIGLGAVSSNVPSGIFVSNDGLNWTISTNAPFTLSPSAAIAYGAGMYVVAISSTFDPKVFSSTDAQHWDAVLTGSHEPIADVTLFKGHWVILGKRGEILESIPISTLKLNPTDNNLTVSGEANTSYELQASEDIASATWSPLTTLQTDPNGSTTTNLSLPAATNLFLRLKQSN